MTIIICLPLVTSGPNLIQSSVYRIQDNIFKIDKGKADNISDAEILKNSIFINAFPPINDFWYNRHRKYGSKLRQR